MPRPRSQSVAVPGQEIDPASTQSNPDEAVAMAQSGQARPIRKLRAVVPDAVLDRPDPSRPMNAHINAVEYDMDEADAIDLDNKGELDRAVLTESGWYCPQNTRQQQAERKRNGKDAMVEIFPQEA